jgi:hypothetical protein
LTAKRRSRLNRTHSPIPKSVISVIVKPCDQKALFVILLCNQVTWVQQAVVVASDEFQTDITDDCNNNVFAFVDSAIELQSFMEVTTMKLITSGSSGVRLLESSRFTTQ